MSTDLVSTELFQETPVRIIQNEKEKLIPLMDVANAAGIDRESLRQLLNRNLEILGQYTCSVITLDQNNGQGRETTCLTRDGVSGLLVKINYTRIKDPVKKGRVIAFQKWAVETLGNAMDIRNGIGEIFKSNMPIATTMSETFGIDMGIAGAVARGR
jgi:hypothetical protein